MTSYYVGLMSGTSMDGIDAVLVSFDAASLIIHTRSTTPYPDTLRRALLDEIRKPLDLAVDPDGQLHRAVGECFSNAANGVIERSGVERSRIAAIGSHGQTLRHRPDAEPPFTIQVGDPALIAAATGVAVIADFRTADIAAGGQGAPLVPPFHEWLFRSSRNDRAVVNIGGVANITVLPTKGDVTGFDTGPGNGLMDAWIREHQGRNYDEAGRWGATGDVDETLLKAMLDDPYFGAAPPKSTGFEYFNANWINTHDVNLRPPEHVQATLCELTARSIADAVRNIANRTSQLFVCGGGAYNTALLQRLRQNMPDVSIETTHVAGLDPENVEACAFAWLAMRTHKGLPGNLPTVTGASDRVVLGEVHSP